MKKNIKGQMSVGNYNQSIQKWEGIKEGIERGDEYSIADDEINGIEIIARCGFCEDKDPHRQGKACIGCRLYILDCDLYKKVTSALIANDYKAALIDCNRLIEKIKEHKPE